jgi:hypothetical protein
MATAMHVARRGDEIKLEFGQAEIFALKYTTGKNVDGRFGPRALFTAVDERKLWLDAEDGSDLERGMRDLGVQPAEFIRVTKIRHARGGGHSIRVELAENERDTNLERDLERSIAAARSDPDPWSPEGYTDSAPPRKAAARTRTAPDASSQSSLQQLAPGTASYQMKGNDGTHFHATQQPNGSPASGTASAKLCACFMAAIDAVSEAQAYADRRGLKITFTSEDVRSTAISCYITACKEGGR